MHGVLTMHNIIMYNVLCEYKRTEENIYHHHQLVILCKNQHCTGGGICGSPHLHRMLISVSHAGPL